MTYEEIEQFHLLETKTYEEMEEYRLKKAMYFRLITKEELERDINASKEWNFELLEVLAEMADMESEWEQADGENFETVIYKMADKIGIKI